MNYSVNGWFYSSLSYRAPAWTGVNEFWNFAINNRESKGVKLVECELKDVEIGDIIQLYNGVRYYHNLLVTDINGDIKITAHDNNVKNLPLRYYNYKSLRCGKIII